MARLSAIACVIHEWSVTYVDDPLGSWHLDHSREKLSNMARLSTMACVIHEWSASYSHHPLSSWHWDHAYVHASVTVRVLRSQFAIVWCSHDPLSSWHLDGTYVYTSVAKFVCVKVTICECVMLRFPVEFVTLRWRICIYLGGHSCQGHDAQIPCWVRDIEMTHMYTPRWPFVSRSRFANSEHPTIALLKKPATQSNRYRPMRSKPFQPVELVICTNKVQASKTTSIE